MTEDQIAELFIRSAEVDRRLPNTARPAQIKSMSLPFVHDHRDVAGWGAERYQQERADFFDAKSTRLTRNDIGIYEVSLELIKLVKAPEQRRSLWAWATAKAGGQRLAKWCRTVEGIKPATASYRAKAAIRSIYRKLNSQTVSHNENDMNADLSNHPENSDKSDIIRAWHEDGVRPPMTCSFDERLRDFSWADAQNARRREREARRRKAA